MVDKFCLFLSINWGEGVGSYDLPPGSATATLKKKNVMLTP